MAMIAFVAVACSKQAATVPVTDQMKSDALAAVEQHTMPDVLDWQMQETDDGIRYTIVTPGAGDTAWYDDKVRVQYDIWLEDGTLVDSSWQDGVSKPLEFTVGEKRVIAGWERLIQQLKPGSEAVAIIPWKLAYGRSGRGKIPGRADLVVYIRFLRFV